jgi:hypothetical protein
MFSDPGLTRHASGWVQVSLMPGTAPGSDKDEGSGQRGKFRGSIAQRLIPLFTLISESRLSPHKTRFSACGGLVRLRRTELGTRRVPLKGFTLE